MSKTIAYDIGGAMIKVHQDELGYRVSGPPGTYDSVEAALMGAVCHAEHATLFVDEVVNTAQGTPISAQTIQSWIDGLIERADG